MVGTLDAMDLARLDALSQQWADQLDAWSIPDSILATATASPWLLDANDFGNAAEAGSDRVDIRLARELLPMNDAKILDVGCGGGRASVPLIPPASVVVGVDERIDMLNEFGLAVTVAGARPISVLGTWPDVVDDTPTADVVVCRYVAYNVADIVPFLIALTDRARLGVVLVVHERHPMTAWNRAWNHFWDIDRPEGPTAEQLVAILRELDEDPEMFHFERIRANDFDRERSLDVASRRLCLPVERRNELAEYLMDSPIVPVRTSIALRWPGRATS